LRAAFADALGFPASETFISGLLVCDGTYIEVDKNDPVNVVDPAVALGGAEEEHAGHDRVLRRLQTSQVQVSITLDGSTVVVMMGVSVPSSLAPSLSSYLEAVMSDDPSADVSSAANDFLSAYQSLAATFPSIAARIPTTLVNDVQQSTGGSAPATFESSLNTAAENTLDLLLAALELTGVNISTRTIPEATGAGSVVGVVSTPPAEEEESSSNRNALAALVIIPIVAIASFFLYKHCSAKSKQKAAQAKVDESKLSGVDGSQPVVVGAPGAQSAGLVVRTTSVVVTTSFQPTQV
jgi:hypothetical protein